MVHQFLSDFFAAEQASRTGDITKWQRHMVMLAYNAASNARKAKIASRAGLVAQVINMLLLAALIYCRVTNP